MPIERLAELDHPADGRFERVVCAAVLGMEGTELRHLSPDLLILALRPAGGHAAVVRAGPEARKTTDTLLERLLPEGPVEVVVVGGDERTRAEAVTPAGGGGSVRVYHLAEDATATGLDPGHPLGRWLADAPDLPPDWDRFWGHLEAHLSRRQAQVQGLGRRLAEGRPRVTWAILAAMAVGYALEATWGGPEWMPALVRTGALWPEAVRDGEVWRLWSAAFLHGSLIHLGFNAWALWAMGRTLEPLLGSTRYLLLFAAAVTVGSLLSVARGEAVSVGASGGLWGIMAAELLLVWAPTKVLPADLARGFRSVTMSNLLLNAVASMRPNVDWAAHLGGGLAGAVLVGTGALLWGLPRWGRPGAPTEDRVPLPVRLGAAVGAAALVASLPLAILVGQPWRLAEAPALLARELDGLPIRLPEGPMVVDGDWTRVGDPMADAATVVVAVVAAPGVTRDTPPEDVPTPVPVDGLPAAAQTGRTTVDGRALWTARYDVRGVALDMAWAPLDGRVVAVGVMQAPGAAGGWEGVARRIAASAGPATPE